MARSEASCRRLQVRFGSKASFPAPPEGRRTSVTLRYRVFGGRGSPHEIRVSRGPIVKPGWSLTQVRHALFRESAHPRTPSCARPAGATPVVWREQAEPASPERHYGGTNKGRLTG